MLSFYYLAPLLAASVLLFLTRIAKVGSRPAGYPPGPPTLPLLGNLHLMPTARPHIQMQKWAKEFGPIYSLMLGTKTMIVLSSDTAVKEVLDKRSGNYSDRPDMFIGQKIASGNLRLVLMKYGDNWRMIHRMIHNILNIKAAVTYVPYQDLENRFLLEGLLDSPQDLLLHLRRFTYSFSTQTIFGYRCIDIRDPNLLKLFETFEKWSELAKSASAQLADLYPVLQKLPDLIAPNVSYAKKLFTAERKNHVDHWIRAKRALDSGKSLPCFCNDLYRAQVKEGFSDDAAAYICSSLLEASSDSTAATLYGFIQAMVVWPEVQKKAQEEIDRVVGADRLPSLEDYENMPYIRCCIKENLRWMPTVILGVPHAPLKDDTYMGYTIPKGATVINNVWAIHMDPERSPNPRVFDPDRFKDDHTSLYQSAVGDEKKRDNFVFGSGRRLCQGIHIVERSLFLGISRLLWAFTFSPAQDAQGQPIKYDIEDLVGGITVEPAEYPVNINPRSEDRSRVVRKSAAQCSELLDPVTKQWKKIPDGMAFSTWMPEHVDV